MNRNSTVKDLKLLLAKWFKLDSEKARINSLNLHDMLKPNEAC